MSAKPETATSSGSLPAAAAVAQVPDVLPDPAPSMKLDSVPNNENEEKTRKRKAAVESNSSTGTHVTRARATAVKSFVKIENLAEGNVQCPKCHQIICVSENGCNVVTCRNHSPHFLYFCAHCKKVSTGNTEYTICPCPKRNTRGTRAQVLLQKNIAARENPIDLLDDDSDSKEEPVIVKEDKICSNADDVHPREQVNSELIAEESRDARHIGNPTVEKQQAIESDKIGADDTKPITETKTEDEFPNGTTEEAHEEDSEKMSEEKKQAVEAEVVSILDAPNSIDSITDNKIKSGKQAKSSSIIKTKAVSREQEKLTEVPSSPPKQKHSTGTRISKLFIDPKTNETKAYEAKVTRFEYVEEKQKWMYYVHYETDDEGEYMSEYAITKHRVARTSDPCELFVEYFGRWFGEAFFTVYINWKEFLQDLNRVPEMASCDDCEAAGAVEGCHATSGAYPLQYALLYPDVPEKVIERLLELYPEALTFYETDWEWNTLHWMMKIHPELENVSPRILRMLLSNKNVSITEMAVEEANDGYDDGTPVDWFLDHTCPYSEQTKTILSCSPRAVEWVLSRHYTRERLLSAKELSYALERARLLESSLPTHESFFTSRFLKKGNFVDRKPLADTLFGCLTREKVKLFHRYLRVIAKGIQKKRIKERHTLPKTYDHEKLVDLSSLTCCVLYCLTECRDCDTKWKAFMEKCPQDLLNRQTTDCSELIHTALRLGFQWEPVIRDMVQLDQLILESLDAKERLPPFLTAVNVTYDWYRSEMSLRGNLYGNDDQQYRKFNNINSTFELLRANPRMVHPERLNNPHAVPVSKRQKKKSASKDRDKVSSATTRLS